MENRTVRTIKDYCTLKLIFQVIYRNNLDLYVPAAAVRI